MRPGVQAARVAALICALAAPAFAQGPDVDPSWLSFPGALRHPSSAVSAGLALCDRWLGDAPFDNPALATTRGIVVSPALVRVSRQDLRANNRNVDETPAFIDFAGASVSVPAGPLAFFAYADQPVLRLEASAFTEGRNAPDPGSGASPANVALDLATREVRAGAGASYGAGAWRVGIAGEWTSRTDRNTITVKSGAPTGNGTATFDRSGAGFGAQIGARLSLPLIHPDALTLGAAARFSPELTIDGDTLAITRASGWEGGLSARAVIGNDVGIYGMVGGAGAVDWEGLGVQTGSTSTWGAGLDYHDPETPWTARFGFGQERQREVPESRAGRFGLGFGWDFTGTVLDVGVMRRNLQREGRPDSYDDRVIATVSVRF